MSQTPRTARGRWVVVATLLATAACTKAEASEFEKRLEAWRAAGPTSYVWTVEATTFTNLNEPVRITASDGEALEAITHRHPVPIQDGYANGVPATVDTLIDWLIRSSADAELVRVRWNEAVGYPEEIFFDPTAFSDDEVTYAVVSFKRL
jgi:Family of unknown function (DUF6174)